MQTIHTDLNRRGAGGTIVVNARRFTEKPVFAEKVTMIDGEDTLYHYKPLVLHPFTVEV